VTSTLRPVKGGGTACTEVSNCPRAAAFRISIKGVLAGEAEPVYACKRHSTVALTRLTAISNDIHVRGINNVRTV
jgi:hypothetical protein